MILMWYLVHSPALDVFSTLLKMNVAKLIGHDDGDE